jgi:membrane associated rhomboid family serine protease
MSNFRLSGFSILPTVVKNLLIINGLCFLVNVVIESRYGYSLNSKLGLYYPGSSQFRPYQLITHIFMHGSFMHLFFNMFSLWMFGNVLENYWGPKRFFIYYFVTGLGAALILMLVKYFEFISITEFISSDQIEVVKQEGNALLNRGMNYSDPGLAKLNLFLSVPTVGASGAVFGLLLAFGMLFPNTELMMIFLPIPIKAKYFVIGYGAIELYQGIANNPADNVAHFAHLGGMLFGFILIKIWNKTRRDTFY